MFAFALWDTGERLLHLARDRGGEKPLYYGRVGRRWVFGSELKALRAYPGFDSPIDRDAIALFLRFGYVPAPYSIYRGVRKLAAGTLLTLLVASLPPREQKVIGLYYYGEATMKQIGAEIGVNESRVSQLHARAIRRLRDSKTRLYSKVETPFFTGIRKPIAEALDDLR